MNAQTRYVDEVFTDSDIMVIEDKPYGVNFSAYVPASLGGPQVIPLYMDIYMPSPAVDTEQDRPVLMYLHTGSFLPKGLVSPMGSRKDSAAVEICKRFAKRGYVAVSATYRLGWQADNTQNLDLRRGSNLLAVYNAVQDAKNAVRYMRATELQGDSLQIDSDNIILLGQGSGGYITFAYATLDNYAEVATPTKFLYEDTVGILGGTVSVGDPYIDTAAYGDWDGYGGKATIIGTNPNTGLPQIDFTQPGRNIENIAGLSSEVKAVVNLGGALGDGAWLSPGDVPMLSVHAVHDFYAPYFYGMVRVPVAGQFWDVVEVAGSHQAIRLANEYGNNYVFQRENYTDTVWKLSMAHGANAEKLAGIYPIGIAPANPSLPFAVNSNPWDFWDPSDPLGANETNPNIKSQSLAYIDTVMDFIIPRLKDVLDASDLSIVEGPVAEFNMFPNPTQGDFTLNAEKRISSVSVLDMTGRVVYAAQPNSKEVTINTANWAKGVYIVKITSGELVGSERLTVH